MPFLLLTFQQEPLLEVPVFWSLAAVWRMLRRPRLTMRQVPGGDTAGVTCGRPWSPDPQDSSLDT